MEASPLGDFGKLSSELRLQIWEHVLSSGSTDILRTNRAIFNDIAGRLYDTFDTHISPSYNDSWFQLQCKRLRVSYHLSKPELTQKHDKLRNLPWGYLKLEVHLYAPDQHDPGQIILLWQRLEDLVYLLNRARSRPSQIVVHLQNHHDHSWVQNGKINESIEYPAGRLPDFLIAFLPLSRLKGVHNLQVIADSHTLLDSPDWALITRACNFVMNNQSEKPNDPPTIPRYRLFYSLASWRIDTAFFLDISMDTIPGPTANLLRRDRFAEWYTTDAPRETTYKQQYLETVRVHPAVVPMHDPILRKWLLRYQYHSTLFQNIVKMTSLSGCLKTDSTAWDAIYPYGLCAFTEQGLAEEQMFAW
ncbi:hypothetical protein BO78DRAFT_395717 [Aspergillus sclerotiicarbonarius CBS 121057]|uniref:Uncharacterized protein n=1 Tax=Aspergillus sclerotiicarbonarius (strain CBS 121057 / IBT 28362) TaxID=1448318 RepID=A0A319EDK9_ASPSB|nr:hypothetical protein BO78DRAFT_395717 [Aspergillus sclerotiicarbonarius CBS 121057]